MTTRQNLAGYETRLLAELRQVVAERAAPAASPAAPSPAAQGSAGWEPAGRRPVAPGWPPRRLALTGALAATAAGLAVTLTVTLPGGQPTAPAPGPGLGPGFAPATTPTAVLDNAALAALREPAVTPRPDQFVYIKRYAVLDDAAHHGSPATHAVETIESWISVSGTREGRSVTTARNDDDPAKKSTQIEFWCQDGFTHPPLTVKGNEHQACTPKEFAAYRPDLPDTAAGMLAYLAHTDPSNPHPKIHAQNILEEAFYLLTITDLTPAQQAALFHALATVPHLKLVPKVTDALGRTGVGIQSRPDHGLTWTAIFDPGTFRPLGANITTPASSDLQAIAVQATIVDRVGQRP
jgi:hypothetical protein